MIRVDKYLASVGIGSRKEIKEYIAKGYITINGEVIKKSSTKVDEKKDKVEFRNEEINYKKYIYIMLNKPKGYISATIDYNSTVLDLLDEKYQNKGIFPVGRLDKDTEGLLLLTNDGKLAHNLLSPNKKVVKKYFVKLDSKLEKDDIIKFKDGIFLEKENYLTKPAELEILSDYECFVYIKEGKYHQVKRMFLSVGKEVVYLKRVKMGELALDDNLSLGEYRNLTDEEINLLKGEL